jgi:hypothetical protein
VIKSGLLPTFLLPSTPWTRRLLTMPRIRSWFVAVIGALMVCAYHSGVPAAAAAQGATERAAKPAEQRAVPVVSVVSRALNQTLHCQAICWPFRMWPFTPGSRGSCNPFRSTEAPSFVAVPFWHVSTPQN